MEDLWPFNEEIVARAIYASSLPIISAVGHETDFTIADFVADLRAPTPSAAAELSVPNQQELLLKLKGTENRLQNALYKKVEVVKLRYEKCMKASVFTNPMQKVNESYLVLDQQIKRLTNAIKLRLTQKKNNMLQCITKLDSLSPLKTLTRGYCIAEFQGKMVKSSKDLKTGDKISLRFSDGQKEAKILEE